MTPQNAVIALIALGVITDICRLNKCGPNEPSDGILGIRIVLRPALWGGLLTYGGFFS